MNRIFNKNTINISFIVFFSLAIITTLTFASDVGLYYCLPIFTLLFYIAAVFYLNSLITFIVLVFITWLVACSLAKFIYEFFYGFEILFYLFYFKVLFLSSIAGFSLAKLSAHYLSQNLFSRRKITLFILNAIIIVVITIIFMFIDISSGSNVKDEISNRLRLARNISEYYNLNKHKYLNNRVVIDEGLLNGLYSIEDGKIRHSFGSDVTILSTNIGISLIYNGIPAGEACHMFYYIDSPAIYGFTDTYVNNELVISRRNFNNTINGKELCNKSHGKVNIRFYGSYIELERSLKYLN